MKTRIAAVTAVLLLALTGCAGTPDETPSEQQAFAQTAQESPAPTESAEPELSADEQWFVDNEVWEAFGRTDEELLDAARLACDEFAAGKTGDDMTLPGIPKELTRFFANGARAQFCPTSLD